MPRTAVSSPLFGLRARGKLGGRRRGSYATRSLAFFPVAHTYYYGVPPTLHDSNSPAPAISKFGVSYLGGDKAFLWRAILRWDLSSVVGRSFSAATLSLHVTAALGNPIPARLSRCTRPAAWSQPAVTWNDFDTAQPWTAGGGDFDDVGPPAALDLALQPTLGTHVLQPLLPFVDDALSNRAGILSLIIRLQDSDPGVSQYLLFHGAPPSPNLPVITLTP